MALLFYQNINFNAPEFLTEEDYENIKRNGLSNQTGLPMFLKFHFNNIIAFIISLFTYLLNLVFINDFTNAMFTLGLIILVFCIPKILIDTYKYLKYLRNEKTYKKRLLALVNRSSSYIQFSNEYNEEFNKSKFGKWLINNFKK
jgi:hypothetical protein